MSYLCRAERQVLAKAYASSLELNLSAPSRDTQVCRTSKSWLSVSSVAGCQQKQHGFFACVYRFSTTTKQPSTVSVYEEKKCLVESGKVTLIPIKNRRGVFGIKMRGICDRYEGDQAQPPHASNPFIHRHSRRFQSLK